MRWNMKISALILAVLLSGCASWTTEYWEQKWDELPEEQKQRYRENDAGDGLPITVCDLTDCIIVWIN